MMSWVKKPLLGREGANITWHQPGQDIQTAGSYGAEGYIYQAMAPPKTFDDKHAVLGSWVIGHEEGSAAGRSFLFFYESASPLSAYLILPGLSAMQIHVHIPCQSVCRQDQKLTSAERRLRVIIYIYSYR